MSLIIDGTNGITFSDGTSPFPAVFRNRIINGDMRIDQRNAGGAVTPTTTTYGVDRWKINTTQSSKLTFQQVADAPPGFKFSTKITVASQFVVAAADTINFAQFLEGQNVVDMGFGTANTSFVTVSFWVKGSVAGTYNLSLNNGSNRSYISSYTVNNVWTKQIVTFPIDTAGTWPTDNTVGLGITFNLGSGTNFQNTSGSWLAGNYIATNNAVSFVGQTNGNTLNITGVQLEPGSAATTFEYRPISVELGMCQRYYEKSFPMGTAPAQNLGVSASGSHRGIAGKAGALANYLPNAYFQVRKRTATGTITTFNPSAANSQVRDDTASVDCSGNSLTATESFIFIQCTGNTSTAVGNALDVAWTYDAEL